MTSGPANGTESCELLEEPKELLHIATMMLRISSMPEMLAMLARMERCDGEALTELRCAEGARRPA